MAAVVAPLIVKALISYTVSRAVTDITGNETLGMVAGIATGVGIGAVAGGAGAAGGAGSGSVTAPPVQAGTAVAGGAAESFGGEALGQATGAATEGATSGLVDAAGTVVDKAGGVIEKAGEYLSSNPDITGKLIEGGFGALQGSAEAQLREKELNQQYDLMDRNRQRDFQRDADLYQTPMGQDQGAIAQYRGATWDQLQQSLLPEGQAQTAYMDELEARKAELREKQREWEDKVRSV